MPILTFSFPGRRFHATPWGAHVNEGQVEWPPSPWRLCRALLATGLTKLGWREDRLPSVAVELLETLCSVLPEYQLPFRTTVAHSRHYMPISGKTTKVFDAFAHTGERELSVSWAVTLSSRCETLLSELAGAMGYLGRAESWVDGRLSPGVLDQSNCRPGTSPDLGEDQEPVTLLAPVSQASFTEWRSKLIKTRPELDVSSRSGKRKQKSQARVPEGIVGCMLQSTRELQHQGWNLPPGSRRVVYHRPTESLVASQPRTRRARAAARPPVECALLSLRSYARNNVALPRHRHAVKQMDHVHCALSRMLGELGDEPCPALTGTRGDGPLLADHRHAHFLPLALERARVGSEDVSELPIDHVLIYAPGKLPELAQRAIQRLRWVHSATTNERQRTREGEPSARGRGRLTTTLVATVSRDELTTSVRDLSSGTRILGHGTTWVSHTPFIAPRYVKRKHPIIAQVRAELNARPQFRDVPVAIEVCSHGDAKHSRFSTFIRRRRSNKPQPPSTWPWSIRLTFLKPVSGPIALGYGSHFGLGLFRLEAG